MAMGKKRRTAEEIIRIVREADQGGSIAEICKQHGISDVTLARWRKQYGGLGPEEAARLRALEKENAKLKELAGAQALIIDEFKLVLKKKGLD
jgi:putative transposase